MEIIHISDTHIGPTRGHTVRGAPVFARAEALVDAINRLPFRPDAVIHTGDVVADPDESSYALAEEVLSRLEAPVHYATGNHDDQAMMRAALTFGPHRSILGGSDGDGEPEDPICYRVEGLSGDIDLLVLDGKVPVEEGPHGRIGEAQAEAVLAALSPERPAAVFLHYPLTPIGSRWIDDHLLVKNGEDFQRRLSEKCGRRLRGIFSGHLHRGLQLYRNGVLQSGVSSPACEFTAGPRDDTCEILPGGPLPFNHITFTPEATMVKSYHLPFPPEP